MVGKFGGKLSGSPEGWGRALNSMMPIKERKENRNRPNFVIKVNMISCESRIYLILHMNDIIG